MRFYQIYVDFWEVSPIISILLLDSQVIQIDLKILLGKIYVDIAFCGFFLKGNLIRSA